MIGEIKVPRDRFRRVFVVFLYVTTQAAQTLFVIYIRDSVALRFEPFKRMYENARVPVGSAPQNIRSADQS